MDQITKYKMNSEAAQKRLAEWSNSIDPTLQQEISLAKWMAEEAAQKGQYPILKDALQLVAMLTKQARLESQKLGLLTHRTTVQGFLSQAAQIVLDVLAEHGYNTDEILDTIVERQQQLMLTQLKDEEIE